MKPLPAMRRHPYLYFVAAALAAGCASMSASGPKATSTLAPTAGNRAAGTVTFTQSGDKVRVVAKISGLPQGRHGFHIHEKGDCSAPDATSAGAHFNPTNMPHGNPASGPHHAGDMPMLEADAAGNATLDATLGAVTVAAGNTGIVGRGVIVHQDPDDYKTQPTGNSGGRIACGIIVSAR